VKLFDHIYSSRNYELPATLGKLGMRVRRKCNATFTFPVRCEERVAYAVLGKSQQDKSIGHYL